MATETGVMASRGQIQIDVVADTSKFAKQVERELKAALRGLRVQPVQVDGDVDPLIRKVRAAQAEIDKSFSGMFAKIKADAGKAGAGIGKALVAGIAAAITSGAGPVVASVASLFAAIGPAAVAAIPAAVGVLSTLQVALFGVGDTLKELMDGDLEKFEKALAKLSPAAQKFFRALQSLGPEISSLKNAVQDRFFQGFDQDLRTTAKTLIGPVKIGMTGVAGDLNVLTRRTLEYVNSSRGVEAVEGVFRATRQVLGEVSKALDPVLSKLIDAVIAGTDAKSIDSAFKRALDTLRPLGEAARNVAASVRLIFSGLDKDGPAVAQSLADATKAVKDFLASAEAQELLGTLGNVMDRIREIAVRLLEILPSLLPAVNGLATGGFGVLLSVVQGVVDVLAPLAEALGGEEELFKNVGAAVAIAVIAVKAYQAALVIATASQIAWSAATTAASVSVTVATAVYNTARVAALLLSTGFLTASTAAYGLVTAMWLQVTAMTAAVAGWIRLAVTNAAATLQLTLYATALRIGRIAVIAWTAAQWLFNAAMAANPIGLVIIAIVALVAALVLAYRNSETFRKIVDAAFKAIADAAIWLWENALKPLWEAWLAGFNLIKAAAALWWSAVVAYFTFIGDAAMTLWGWIKTAWNGIVAAFNFVVAGASAFVSMVVGYFVNLKNQALANISALIGFVQSIPGRIVSAVGNLGSVLYNAGRSVIQGLINGVQSMISSLQSKFSFVTDLIPDWKGPEDKDRRLLVPAGRAIMQGLQSGIGSEEANLKAQLAQITAQVAATPVTTQTFQGAVRGGDGAEQGGLRVWPNQAGSTPTLVIQSDGSRYSELLVQEISHAVRIRGGNTQKVLGKTQGGVQ